MQVSLRTGGGPVVPVLGLLLKVPKNSPFLCLQNAGGRGQIVGVRGLPLPRLQKAGSEGILPGSGAGCRGSCHPTCRVRLGEQARLRSLWAPFAVGRLPPVRVHSGGPLALLEELVQPVCFRSRSLCRGGGGGCSPGRATCSSRSAVYQKCQPIKGDRKAVARS